MENVFKSDKIHLAMQKRFRNIFSTLLDSTNLKVGGLLWKLN